MTKLKFLYYESRKRICGNKLAPRKAGRLGDKEKDKLTAVYSTHKKDAAIIMGIISGAKLSNMHFYKGKAKGIIYEGWPKREEVYLYFLSPKEFSKIDNWQWCSCQSVKIKKTLNLPRTKVCGFCQES